jgi:hypothetical protein
MEKKLRLSAYRNGTGRVVFFASSKSSSVITKRSIIKKRIGGDTWVAILIYIMRMLIQKRKTWKTRTVQNLTWSSSLNVKLLNGFSYANFVSQVQLRLSRCKLTRLCIHKWRRGMAFVEHWDNMREWNRDPSKLGIRSNRKRRIAHAF